MIRGKQGGPGPPRFWEEVLRLVLPAGPVGGSVHGDLHEDHAARAAVDRAHADAWYGRAARSVAFWAVARRLRSFGRGAVGRATPSPSSPSGGSFLAVRDVLVGALRSVRRSPRLALAVALTLALGIGANVTIFGIVDRLLLSPPPGIEDPDEVRLLYAERLSRRTGEPQILSSLTYPDYQAFKELGTFSRVAAFEGAFDRTLGRGASAERIKAKTASPDFFPLLGVEPVLGRLFTREDAEPGAQPTVVLTEPFWRRRFGADPSVLGRALAIGEGTYTVVGVTPEGFIGADLEPVDVFLNLEARAQIELGDRWRTTRSWWWTAVVARLAPGVDPAAGDAAATSAYLAARSPDLAPTERMFSSSLVAADAPRAPAELEVTRWLAGVSLLVLLIACANVANLLLVRATRRRQELAVQRALGLSRRRLVGQILVEGLILSALGGAAALLLAQWGGAALRTTLFPEIHFDSLLTEWRILGFTGLAVLAATCLAGLVPALRTAGGDVTGSLKDGGRGATADRSTVRHVLVAVQAGLTIVLLAGAGLFVRSLGEALDVDLGFDPELLVTATLELDGEPAAEEQVALYYRAIEHLRRLPSVRAVTFHTAGPFQGSLLWSVKVDGWDAVPSTLGGGPFVYPVGPDYFETMGMHVLTGRGFTDADHTPDAERVAVVNREMERVLWPESGALGRCIHIQEGPCNRVVGVVSNTSRSGLVEDPGMMYYVPMLRERVGQVANTLVLRMAAPGAEPPAGLSETLMGVSSDVRFVRIGTYREILEPRLRSWRLGATVFSAFGVLALLVAAVGLYSTLSFQVAQRRAELGIRSALGATADRLMAVVVTQTLAAVAVGAAAGVALAIVAGRGLEALLFQVRPTDPAAYASAVLAVGVLGLLAAAVPAWRATRADPVEALRSE